MKQIKYALVVWLSKKKWYQSNSEKLLGVFALILYSAASQSVTNIQPLCGLFGLYGLEGQTKDIGWIFQAIIWSY